MKFIAQWGAELLKRFRDGEKRTLDEVYRTYVDSVARTVAGAIRQYRGSGPTGGWREIATELPDLVQEVFTRAFDPETRRRFDGVRDYGPYLGQIARHVALDYLRRKWRLVVQDAEPLLDQRQELSPEGGDDLADREIMALVGRYVALLPADLRGVHHAMYEEGLSQREAAAALGLSRQVVRTLESRLKEGLRTVLTEHGQLEAPERLAARPSLPLRPTCENGEVTR